MIVTDLAAASLTKTTMTDDIARINTSPKAKVITPNFLDRFSFIFPSLFN
jgi:hypothetical protein